MNQLLSVGRAIEEEHGIELTLEEARTFLAHGLRGAITRTVERRSALPLCRHDDRGLQLFARFLGASYALGEVAAVLFYVGAQSQDD